MNNFWVITILIVILVALILSGFNIWNYYQTWQGNKLSTELSLFLFIANIILAIIFLVLLIYLIYHLFRKPVSKKRSAPAQPLSPLPTARDDQLSREGRSIDMLEDLIE